MCKSIQLIKRPDSRNRLVWIEKNQFCFILLHSKSNIKSNMHSFNISMLVNISKHQIKFLLNKIELKEKINYTLKMVDIKHLIKVF